MTMRLRMWLARFCRRHLCPRGVHAYSPVSSGEYKHSPWTWWRGSKGEIKFGRHCDHCGAWQLLDY